MDEIPPLGEVKKGETILLKAQVHDFDRNPYGVLIFTKVQGDSTLTHPYDQEIRVHRLDRKHILLCPRYASELSAFALAMADKLTEKAKEHGDSWKEMPIPDLVKRLKQEFDEFYPIGIMGNYQRNELVDIANICMMLYERIKKLEHVDFYCDICKTTDTRVDDGALQYCGTCDSRMRRV